MSKSGCSIHFPAEDTRPGPAFVASAIDIRRINHRMHNKLFVADNALAITGGRNIGDQYFTRDQHNNFIDLDVVAAGAIVPELSASFDAFWNSKYAYPIASVADAGECRSRPAAAVRRRRLRDDANWLAARTRSGKVQLTWVPATVLADRRPRLPVKPRPMRRSRSPTTSGVDAFGATGAHRHLAVLRARQGRRRAVRQAGGARACTFGS